MLRFAVVTLMPAMLDGVVSAGVTGRALARGLIELARFNPRDFSEDKHRRVDDRPYGGGPGMVMQVAPLRAATRAARRAAGEGAVTVLLSPQGERLDQPMLARFAGHRGIVLVCGRYEGVDERFIETEVNEEVSLGDFVISGGEIAAMAVIDGVSRLLPGALGHEDSADQDSFASGRLDCPHYTRPETIDGRRVPEVMLSGNHAAIARWRMKQSLGRTALRRPDLLRGLSLGADQRALLDEYLQEHAAEQAPPKGDKQ